jgi:transposase-like protein
MKKDTNKKGKRQRGAPTRYNSYIPVIAELAMRNGYTIEQLAEKIGVCEKTLYNWQEKHPELLQAIKSGRSEPVGRLENALYRSAEGYDVIEETEFFNIDEKGEKVLSSVKRQTKHVPSNSTALIFSLCNMTSKWKRKQEVVIEEKKIVINRIKAGKEEE